MLTINKVKNKDFPTFFQTLRILIHTEGVEILGPRFGRIQKNELKRYFINSYNHKSLVELGRVYQEIIFFHITFGFSERNTYLCSHISFN